MRHDASANRLAVAKPLYSQVREVLLKRIGEGEWGAGEALPNEFVLSNDFGVSIGTIRRAIEGLEETGVLKRIQGRGTYVAGPGATALDEKFCRLRLDGKPLPELSYELHAVQRRTASGLESVHLHISPGDAVVEVRQRLTTSKAPVGYEVCVVAASRFPRLETQHAYGQLVYRVLADYGVLVTRALESISAATAPADVAEALEICPSRPVLAVERLSLTIDKDPVEYRRSHYNLARIDGLSYATAIT